MDETGTTRHAAVAWAVTRQAFSLPHLPHATAWLPQHKPKMAWSWVVEVGGARWRVGGRQAGLGDSSATFYLPALNIKPHFSVHSGISPSSHMHALPSAHTHIKHLQWPAGLAGMAVFKHSLDGPLYQAACWPGRLPTSSFGGEMPCTAASPAFSVPVVGMVTVGGDLPSLTSPPPSPTHHHSSLCRQLSLPFPPHAACLHCSVLYIYMLSTFYKDKTV